MALAYFDTASGIAGDMTLAALVDAGADTNYLQRQIDSLGLPDVQLEFSTTMRHCFRALRLDVRHPPEQAHRHLSDILSLIEHSELNARQRNIATRLFKRLGSAEAHVHGTDLESVHFHEVGAIDSVVDIVGVAVALDSLGIDRIVASPTPIGSGTIQIAHGQVSVPAPATAHLLKGIPIRHSQVDGELTTPTGAAILATLADGFGTLPSMQLTRVGYGAGHKEFSEQANLLRVLIGTPLSDTQDEVALLETNIDDASGEKIGFAVEQLWQTGALEVFTTAISMKKNRPAVLLSVICPLQKRASVEDVIFKHTGSLGIRRTTMARTKLPRETLRVETKYGECRVKIAWQSADHDSDPQIAPEYDDCRSLALTHGLPLDVVYRAALQAAEQRAADLSPPARVNAEALGTDHSHDHNGHDQHHH